MFFNSIKALPYVDYVQSANSLFHFMGEFGYLETALLRRALIPRYCNETINYLHINNAGTDFNEVSILQKCFCDIPLHKIAETFSVAGVGEAFENLTPEEKFDIQHNNTHFDFYGSFAIGFSKDWCERNGLQPIHYLNTEAPFCKEFQQVLLNSIVADDLPDIYTEDILHRLAFIKPLRGSMQRTFKRTDGSEVVCDIYKNFHDECEWRFVPSHNAVTSVKLDSVTAKQSIIRNQEYRGKINRNLESKAYESLWLRFEYDDIRYFIVPDNHHRIKLIETIREMPDSMFTPQDDIYIKKQIMVSKILVLDEIRRDW